MKMTTSVTSVAASAMVCALLLVFAQCASTQPSSGGGTPPVSKRENTTLLNGTTHANATTHAVEGRELVCCWVGRTCMLCNSGRKLLQEPEEPPKMSKGHMRLAEAAHANAMDATENTTLLNGTTANATVEGRELTCVQCPPHINNCC